MEVHYLTKASFAGLLESNPYVDRVHTIDKDVDHALVQKLRAEQFDFVIDLHNNLRTLRLKSALKVPSKSFPKLNVQKWLLVTFKVRRMPDVHIVDRYLETVKHLGVENDGEGLDYFIPEGSVVECESLARNACFRLCGGGDRWTARHEDDAAGKAYRSLPCPKISGRSFGRPRRCCKRGGDFGCDRTAGVQCLWQV